MELEFQYSRPALTPADVRRFEADSGLLLPADYRAFLLAHNGAVFQFDYPAYRIRGNERQPEGLLQCLFCLHDGDPIDMRRVSMVHRGRVPDGLLPIGSDPGNNLICLGVDGEYVGRVYFWERSKEHSPPTSSNVYPLADDFNSFLKHLYPFDA